MKYFIITAVLFCLSIVVVAQDYHGNHPADAIRAMRAAEQAKAEKAAEITVEPIPDELPNLDIQDLLDNISRIEKELAELKKGLTTLKSHKDWAPPHPKEKILK